MSISKKKNDIFKLFEKNNYQYDNKKLIENRFLNQKNYCSDLILNDIKKIQNKKKFKINIIKFRLLGFIFNLKDKFLKKYSYKHNNQSFYKARRTLRNKNPGISKKEIVNFYNNIEIKNDIKVVEYIKNGFLISKN